jgi:hypothetical protein
LEWWADFNEILFPCIIKKINFRPYLCGGLWIFGVFSKKRIIKHGTFLVLLFSQNKFSVPVSTWKNYQFNIDPNQFLCLKDFLKISTHQDGSSFAAILF